MISELDGIINLDLVAVLRSEGFYDVDAEDQESVEDRVITASLKMIRRSKKKSSEATERLMLFFAVFAEDIPVPTTVLTTCVPSIVLGVRPSEKTKIATRASLTTLLKYNLIKGSLAEGSGTFCHDIVRDVT